MKLFVINTYTILSIFLEKCMNYNVFPSLLQTLYKKHITFDNPIFKLHSHIMNYVTCFEI